MMKYNEEQYLQHAYSIQSNIDKLWGFHCKTSAIDRDTLFSLFSYHLIENACKSGISLEDTQRDFYNSLETFYEIHQGKKP